MCTLSQAGLSPCLPVCNLSLLCLTQSSCALSQSAWSNPSLPVFSLSPLGLTACLPVLCLSLRGLTACLPVRCLSLLGLTPSLPVCSLSLPVLTLSDLLCLLFQSAGSNPLWFLVLG